MGVGVGVLLIVLGLILLFAVNVNLPWVTDDALGMIFILGGVLAIILVLIMNAQRSRTKHVQENRYDGPPSA